jgi:hypothetical protein
VSDVQRSAEVRALAVVAWAQAKADGTPCAVVADLFRVCTRSLRRWAERARGGEEKARRRGRPRQVFDRFIRQGVIAMLLVVGPRVGVETLREMFGTVPHRQLGDFKRRMKAVMKRREGYRQQRLQWLVAGATWAMDFTKARGELSGGATHLLVVRDLASGMRLAIVSSVNECGLVVRETLEKLILMHGAPLVIKHDGGGAFTCDLTKRLLRRYGVLALRSPCYTPRYNGSCERDIGWTKLRIENTAWVAGHAGRWGDADIERARALMNLTTRCGTGSARAAFDERPSLPLDRRRAFKRLWISMIRSARVTHVACFGRMPDAKQREALRRQTLQQALLEQRYLTIRRGRLSTPDFGIGVDRVT